MFVLDGGAWVLMVSANHEAANPTPTNTLAVTLDGSGNIYVSDLNGTVNELLVNTGALKFLSLNSSPTTTVTNTGTFNLNITSLTSPMAAAAPPQ
jgi:hypothetical protein